MNRGIINEPLSKVLLVGGRKSCKATNGHIVGPSIQHPLNVIIMNDGRIEHWQTSQKNFTVQRAHWIPICKALLFDQPIQHSYTVVLARAEQSHVFWDVWLCSTRPIFDARTSEWCRTFSSLQWPLVVLRHFPPPSAFLLPFPRFTFTFNTWLIGQRFIDYFTVHWLYVIVPLALSCTSVYGTLFLRVPHLSPLPIALGSFYHLQFFFFSALDSRPPFTVSLACSFLLVSSFHTP